MSNTAVEPTSIASHTLIKGEIHFAGPAMIGGRVEGAITSQDALEISADGSVEGDIRGVLIDVQGAVKGNIIASQACRLGPTAKVAGELRAANLAIAEGACFVGQVYVGGPATELAEPAEEPEPAVDMSPAIANRIQQMTAQVESLAEMAATTTIAAPAPVEPPGSAVAPTGPSVRILPQTVQQTLNRGPRIIKAR